MGSIYKKNMDVLKQYNPAIQTVEAVVNSCDVGERVILENGALWFQYEEQYYQLVSRDKDREAELNGQVKFMFQPAEETFEGAKDMIEHGILEDPVPDAALAYHVTSGQTPIGLYMYNNTGTMMASVDGFRIILRGRGCYHPKIRPKFCPFPIYCRFSSQFTPTSCVSTDFLRR